MRSNNPTVLVTSTMWNRSPDERWLFIAVPLILPMADRIVHLHY